ncbi:hypothetical protein [Trichormus azollae]|jgi:hypothetical protein|uniref:hypothetical protein n=1 Tax=Trichormus azollae TaxID=1164 RepID=UPI0001956ED9|nr:hypothetical protein [Trichormus azollae]
MLLIYSSGKYRKNTEVTGRVTRLDQSWSIFAPAPPRDDGWNIIPASLENGSEVDIFRCGNPVNWDKTSLSTRSGIYHNMQWLTYFINLNGAIGKKLYPFYGKYLCYAWNTKHKGGEKLENSTSTLWMSVLFPLVNNKLLRKS